MKKRSKKLLFIWFGGRLRTGGSGRVLAGATAAWVVLQAGSGLAAEAAMVDAQCLGHAPDRRSYPSVSDTSLAGTGRVVYALDPTRGLFALPLEGPGRQFVAGAGRGASYDRLRISPGGRYVLFVAEFRQRRTTMMFDTSSDRTVTVPETPDEPISFDDTWLATWTGTDDFSVRAVNLRDRAERLFRLPADLGLGDVRAEWAAGRDVLRVHVEGHRDFEVDAVSGRRHDLGVSAWRARAHVLAKAVAPPGFSFRQSDARDRDYVVQRLAIRHPDGRIAGIETDRLWAPVAADRPVLACGPDGIRVRDVLGGDIVLYTVNDVWKIYGIREERSAFLDVPPHGEVAWAMSGAAAK